MNDMSREWDTEDDRQRLLKQISDNEDIGELYKIISIIEQAFCDPFQVTTKKVNGDAEVADDNEEDNANKDKDNADEDKNDQIEDQANQK